MNILYTTNDLFVPKVGASICSILENNREMEELNVYIIGQDISNVNRERLTQLVERYKRKIEIIALGDLNQYFDFSYDTLGWNSVILARLLLDRLLPKEIEKILYLDGDTITLCSLEKLWNTDLQGNVLGACIEATVDEKRRIGLGMKCLPYINSGVLLIDLKRWREEDWGRRIIEYYRQQGGKLFAPDQDAINGTLKGNIMFLPPCYNFYNIYWIYPYEFLKKKMGEAPYYDKRVFDNSVKHPVIIHYLGEERPWRRGNTHKYRKEYKVYLAKTPWAAEKDEEGWELYFLCWRIFNCLIKPFPTLRYKIINGLIPGFMKFRKLKLKKKK